MTPASIDKQNGRRVMYIIYARPFGLEWVTKITARAGGLVYTETQGYDSSLI